MSTSLLNCEILLSKEIGDYWASTTTSAGNTAKTTLIDTALKAKAADWITDNAYDMINDSDSAADEEERKILDLVPNDGTLSVLAHSAQIATSIDYRIHRLFTASDKRRALVRAAKLAFPSIHAEVRDENLTVGNILRDPIPKWNWTATTTNTYWKASTGITLTETTTYPYYLRGGTSMKITGTQTGYAYQSDTQNADLLKLAGKTVKFKCKAWCNTADALRLGICYDGTNISYGDHHPGTSNWADEDNYNQPDDFLWVEKQIDYDPTAVSVRVYLDDADATAYVNDLRLEGPDYDKVYIGSLNLAQERPHRVFQAHNQDVFKEPWILLHGCKVGSDDYLYLPPSAIKDYQLRILGINYLDFYDTDGDVGTDWDDTIAIDEPQTEILVAQAAIYLCMQKIMPTEDSATARQWQEALAFWTNELRERKKKFGMKLSAATVNWGT